jgi:hypothetical protein
VNVLRVHSCELTATLALASPVVQPGMLFGASSIDPGGIYFPIQKLEKIRFRMSSAVVAPVS